MSFDVIVVGAGSAGAALAARLTEDESHSVLLLETGPDYRSADTPPEIQSVEPGAVRVTEQLANTHTFADLVALRTPVQERWKYFRGRGIGGSSSVNGMFAIRATVDDFNGWAAAGAKGWSYDEMLPLMNHMERDLDFGSESYHGSDGPIPVMRPKREDFCAFDAAFADAAEANGHPFQLDHNAPGATGVSPFAYNGFKRRRVSTNDGYLEPARGRANLTITGDAHVERVLFQGDKAVGVRAVVGGELKDFHAEEVVISAGVIHSPAILQRSGLGPARLLEDLGLDVVAELPVGLGLQEHASMAMSIVFNEPLDYGNLPTRGQVCLRFTSGVDNEPNDLMVASCGALGLGLPAAGVVGWVNRPASYGTIEITSVDATVDPKVDFNLLSAPQDMVRYRILLDEMRAIVARSRLPAMSAALGFGTDFAPLDQAFTDEEFTAFALKNVGDTVHGTSTCKMGAPDDPSAVVDAEGRVLGVSGLRVADASILPWTTRANTNLTAILVGEKIADCMRGARS